MKQYKILGLILLILGLLSVAYSLPDTNITSYYKMDINSTSQTDTLNNNTLTVTGTGLLFNSTGKINGGYTGNGTLGYMASQNNIFGNGNFSQQFTVNAWISPKSNGGGAYVWSAEAIQQVLIGPSGDITLEVNSLVGGGSLSFTTNSTCAQGSWCMVTVAKNTTHYYIYINNTLAGRWANVSIGNLDGVSRPFAFAGRFDGVGPLNGSIDEASIFMRGLNSTDINCLYNSGIGTQYPFSACQSGSLTYASINLTNGTQTNQSSLSIGINITATNTNTDINTTMYLNNGSTYQIGTNTQNVSYTLPNIQEGTYNIWFFSINNQSNVTSSNYTYTFDFTSPNITNNIASEITQYTINLNTNITVTDSIGVSYCYFNVSNGQNALCNSTSFTFNISGNLTYNIEAKDISGNTNIVSGSVYVNPYQYLRFNDSVRNVLITNYNLNNTLFTISNEYAYAKLYDIGLTNTNLLFYKFGYNNYSFTLTTTSTSSINTTYNVTPVNLTLQVFDEQVPTRQLTFNVTIQNSTTVQTYYNQVNFSKFYNETPTGLITLTITSSDFNQTYCLRKLFTDLTPSAAISLTAYLLPNTSCYPVIFTILDIRQTQGISGVTLTFSKLINTTTYTVGQAQTDSTGKTYFNMDTDEDYIITISKTGYVTSTLKSLPNTFSYTLTLPAQQTGTTNPFQGVVTLVRPTGQVSLPVTVYGYTQDSLNLLSASYFTVTTAEGIVLNSNSSTNSGGVNMSYVITSNSSYYVLNLTILRNGTYFSTYQTINFVNSSGFGNVTIVQLGQTLDGVQNNGDRVFIMLIVVVIFMLIGGFLAGLLGVGGSLAVITGIIPFFFFAQVGWLSMIEAILFIVVGLILAMWFDKVV